VLAYVLTLENPDRFVKSRDVGPYLGLVPKQEDSGESQPQLGISKTGDTTLRKLLVGSAHYILGPFGPDTDLRRLWTVPQHSPPLFLGRLSPCFFRPAQHLLTIGTRRMTD
jgi:hypothetical protein